MKELEVGTGKFYRGGVVAAGPLRIITELWRPRASSCYHDRGVPLNNNESSFSAEAPRSPTCVVRWSESAASEQRSHLLNNNTILINVRSSPAAMWNYLNYTAILVSRQRNKHLTTQLTCVCFNRHPTYSCYVNWSQTRVNQQTTTIFISTRSIKKSPDCGLRDCHAFSVYVSRDFNSNLCRIGVKNKSNRCTFTVFVSVKLPFPYGEFLNKPTYWACYKKELRFFRHNID